MKHLPFTCLLFLALSAAARAYINAPVEKLTLPEMLKEFKSVQIIKAGSVDLDQGVVVWEFIEQLHGDKDPTRSRHIIHLRDGVPPSLKKLKPDQTAVFFSQDGWKRGIILTEGCWYLAGYEEENKCWRISFTDRWYDFNTCFSGSPDELVVAIRKLLKGEDAVVKCRVKPKEPELETVRYSMKQPHEKTVVTPTTKPAQN